jgi:hypothetical protein
MTAASRPKRSETMKFVIVIAASIASAVLLVPTVTQAEPTSTAQQVHVAATKAVTELRA